MFQTIQSFHLSREMEQVLIFGQLLVRVLDAAVEKAYKGERKLVWKEVLAGEKAFNQTGEWLPKETLDVISEYLIAIKGPLTTPVGGGIRSLNVALASRVGSVCMLTSCKMV